MRRLLILPVLLATVASADANECLNGSGDILRLSSWSAEPVDDHSTAVTLTYENVTQKGIEIVNATAWFYDALDNGIGGIPLDSDPQLEPAGSITVKRKMLGFQRVLKVKPENISAVICTDAVLYDDGTRETFN